LFCFVVRATNVGTIVQSPDSFPLSLYCQFTLVIFI
jgi:hypothetical protein